LFVLIDSFDWPGQRADPKLKNNLTLIWFQIFWLILHPTHLKIIKNLVQNWLHRWITQCNLTFARLPWLRVLCWFLLQSGVENCWHGLGLNTHNLSSWFSVICLWPLSHSNPTRIPLNFEVKQKTFLKLPTF